MPKVQFTLETEPKPAARPRVFRNGGVAYPKAHTEYVTWLNKNLKELDVRVPDPSSLFEVTFEFVMPPYKTSDYPAHRADLDNLEKIIMDCMTKAVDGQGNPKFWLDDNLVVSKRGLKRFSKGSHDPVRTNVLLVPVSDLEAHERFSLLDG